MLLTDYMQAIVNDLNTNAPFLKDVGTHGRVFGLEELKKLVLVAPAVRIAMIGSRGGSSALPRSSASNVLNRTSEGQFRGPLQMIAFLIEQDPLRGDARDKLIVLADQFITFLEHRTFGLSHNDAGPALVTGFEILYSSEIDDQGAAIAAVSWEQEVVFGRNLHLEDEALLQETGGDFVPDFTGAEKFPEKDYEGVGGWHSPASANVKGRVTPQFTGDTEEDTEDHEPV
jgi:hypothetical protein